MTIYTCFIIRLITEYAAPVWNGALTLTKQQITHIERVQKKALKIIFGSTYTTYDEVLDNCNLQS